MEYGGCLDTRFLHIFKEEPDNLKTLHILCVCVCVCVCVCLTRKDGLGLSNSANFILFIFGCARSSLVCMGFL